MELELERVLDECLSQLNKGADLEVVLSRYPAQAEELRPALQAALAIRQIPTPVASAQARAAGKARLLAAVADRQAQFEQVVDACLAAVASSEVGVDTVLEEHPEFAPRLRPMLRAAQIVRSTPQPVPSVAARAAAKRELLLAVARKRQERVAPAGLRHYVQVFVGFLQGLSQPALPLGRAAFALLAVLVFLTATGYGVTQVAASSLPDSPLYPVKLATEEIELALAPSPAARARLFLSFSERRLEEATKIATTGRGLDRALSEMVKNNDQAMRVIAQLPVDERPALFADLADLALKERKVLGQVRPLVPASGRGALDEAIARSADAQAKAEEARKNPRRAELLPTGPAPTLMLVATETPVATWTPVPPEPTEAPIRRLPSPTPGKPTLQPPKATATPAAPEPTPMPPPPTPTSTQARSDFSVRQPRPPQTDTPVPPPPASPAPETTPALTPPQPTASPPIHLPTLVPPPGGPDVTPTANP